MAEQCIVCLDTLLHAAEPPPQPLDEDLLDTGVARHQRSNSGPPTTPVRTTAITAGASKSTSTSSAVKAEPDLGSVVVKTEHEPSAAAGNSNDSHNDDNVAIIQVCGHMLHDTCLREWTGKANSCPICRQSFHLVHVYDRIGGTLLSSYKVEDKKQVAEFDPQAWLDEYAEAEDEDVSTPCPVCNQADREEVLLLCDGCDTPYHTHCIGLDNVPRGAWFCMECLDLFGQSVEVPAPRPAVLNTAARRAVGTGRRPGPGALNRQNDFFPRTRHTMRRARRRARSDEWQGAWGQITGRVWDALHIDLDHDDDEALEEFRRVERLRDNERREFERWQERLDIARRLGAQDIFERSIPSVILQHASRHASGSSSRATPLREGSRVQAPPPPAQTPEERRAWGAFEKARECDPTTPNNRKRKSRSITASPVDPPPEPERKLKRPRTRRIGAHGEPSASARSPLLGPGRANRPMAEAGPVVTAAAATSTAIPLRSSAVSGSGSGSGLASGSVSAPASVAASAAAPAPVSAAASGSGASPGSSVPVTATGASGAHDEPPSFLSSLLREVEMSTPSDDENIRSLFNDPRPALVDPSSPVASSPAASAYSSPRALSTTPPPHRALRPSSPTLLSSHIEPIYPPANYSPTRSSVSHVNGANGVNGASHDHHDSDGNSSNSTSNNAAHGTNGVASSGANANNQRGPTTTVELRQPRPRRLPSVPQPRSEDVSPSRNQLTLEMKESISSIVRTALKPHWKSAQLTADQYAAINRDVSRKLYEEVTGRATIDAEARKLWETKASREVAQAVADLKA